MGGLARNASCTALLVLCACSLMLEFDNEVESLADGSIVGRLVMEETGTGALVPASPCRVAVQWTPISVAAGADGRFDLARLPSGEHSLIMLCDPNGDGAFDLKARRPGIRLDADDAVDLGQLVVEATGVIAGQVVRRGQAVGAGVSVYLEDTELSDITDEQGRFAIDFVGVGAYTVVAAQPGWLGQRIPVQVRSRDTTQVEVELEESQTAGLLAGRVRIWGNDDPGAYGGIAVRLIGGTAPPAATATDGSYNFDDLPVGIYGLEASLVGHHPASVQVVAVRAGPDTSWAPDMFLISEQLDDCDGDGEGDATDLDDDNDLVPDGEDALPCDAKESRDSDHDGIGDNADPDDDNDGVDDWADACPYEFAQTANGCPDGDSDSDTDTDTDTDSDTDTDTRQPCADPTDCEDGNPCTRDECGADGYCRFPDEANGLACDDLDVCTGNDLCTDGVCGGAADGSTCQNPECQDRPECQGSCPDGSCDNGETCETCEADCGPCEACPNGVKEGTEECDGSDFGGLACADVGFPNGGLLGCTADCHYDTSNCVPNDLCQPDSCNSHGSCDDTGGSIACSCDPCWTGDSCESMETNGTNCDDDSACTQADACLDGVCTGSPVSCDMPPADDCISATEVRHYEAVGTCEPTTGACEYGYSVEDCTPDGCEQGSCATGG